MHEPILWVPIDFGVFRDAAQLLYAGPWVAERFAAVGDFLMRESKGVDKVVAEIIMGSTKYFAVDAYRAAYKLEELKRRAMVQWSLMDVLLLPTAGTIYTLEAVDADPIRLNSNLGYYTNFVNLMDLAAVAVPGGFRTDGLPFGVSLIGPAFSDEALLRLAGRFLGERASRTSELPGCVLVAVAGAHHHDRGGQPAHRLLHAGNQFCRGGIGNLHKCSSLLPGAIPAPDVSYILEQRPATP